MANNSNQTNCVLRLYDIGENDSLCIVHKRVRNDSVRNDFLLAEILILLSP